VTAVLPWTLCFNQYSQGQKTVGNYFIFLFIWKDNHPHTSNKAQRKSRCTAWQTHKQGGTFCDCRAKKQPNFEFTGSINPTEANDNVHQYLTKI